MSSELMLELGMVVVVVVVGFFLFFIHLAKYYSHQEGGILHL